MGPVSPESGAGADLAVYPDSYPIDPSALWFASLLRLIHSEVRVGACVHYQAKLKHRNLNSLITLQDDWQKM